MAPSSKRTPPVEQPVHTARLGRHVPWNCKLTREESAAMLWVAVAHDTTPEDLIRDRSLNDIVGEYRQALPRQQAAASA